MKIRTMVLTAMAVLSFSAQAVTVKDEKGDFTIDKTPARIVALEFSFVDALANVGVSPIGIADDNERNRTCFPHFFRHTQHISLKIIILR